MGFPLISPANSGNDSTVARPTVSSQPEKAETFPEFRLDHANSTAQDKKEMHTDQRPAVAVSPKVIINLIRKAG